MSTLTWRYPLDPDGNKADNLVTREPHKLSATVIRAISPTYGLFFNDSVVVRDADANRNLEKSEFRIVELNGEATLKFGKAISALILVTNTEVSENVTIDYQVLGDLYQNSAESVGRMYELWLNDSRPVDWANVNNKPYEFPPSLHNHLLRDVYGFEPLAVALERIRNAILLQDIPAYEALIDWVNQRTLAEVTETEILNMDTESTGAVTLRRMLFAMQHLNFNAIRMSPNMVNLANGQSVEFTVETNAMVNGEKLYWRIKHGNTSASDFATTAGSMTVLDNRAKFTVYLALNPNLRVEEAETFHVELRTGSSVGPVMYTSGEMSIRERRSSRLLDAMVKCCFKDPRIKRNALNLYILGD